jgi:hypothetical protein
MGSTENTHTTERRFGTLAVHAGAPHDPVTGAVIAPVCYALSLDLTTFIDNYHRSPSPLPSLRPALAALLVSTSTLVAPTPTGQSFHVNPTV